MAIISRVVHFLKSNDYVLLIEFYWFEKIKTVLNLNIHLH
ncbi:MAG: hypothetical protein RIQ94_1413 [Pseudomonadota bacterium]|jgi:hypothetical protein